MIHVLLADDNAQFRGVLRRLLEREDAITVLGEAGNGRDAVRLAEELQPDLVLMDVSMPGLDGIAATRILKSRHPDMQVLLLSIGNKPQEVAAGLAGGACEYLVKGTAASDIVAAVYRHAGQARA